MKSAWWIVRITAFCVGLWLAAGCITSPTSTETPDNVTGAPDNGGGPAVPVDNSSGSNGDSVGDVTVDPIGDPPATDPLPANGVSARVRNESQIPADVILRFIRGDSVVHLAFLRTLPQSITSLTSPETPTELEVSGVNDAGQALIPRKFVFGVDFDEGRPAEYVIGNIGAGDPADPTDPVGEPPSISVLEPRADVQVAVGEALRVRWIDGGGPAAVVVVSLRAVAGGELITFGPAVGAALDGINDTLDVLLEGISEGTYEVIVEVRDGERSARAVAPGKVVAMAAAGNAAPTITIDEPLVMQTLRRSDNLVIRWTDADPDDNATIRFALSGAAAAGVPTGEFPIGPPVAEDPDGANADRLVVPLAEILPGDYDLLATIDDGRLAGTARRDGAIRVLPDPVNRAPRLLMLAPDHELNIPVGGSFDVRWDDGDDNDDARLSLLLDPDVSGEGLSGNEVLLAGGISEDADGDHDRITLGIPGSVVPGRYRVVGVLTDGVLTAIAFAPGAVFVTTTDEGGDDNLPHQVRRIAFLQPVDDLRTRVGHTIPLRLESSGISASSAVRLFLTGVNEDGDSLRAEITPAGFTLAEATSLSQIAVDETIPNKWWPRSFGLEAEVAMEGVRYVAIAPGKVLLRQEVEIDEVLMIGYWCADDSRAELDDEDELFFGLELRWSGGGYSDLPGLPGILQAAEPLDVSFWISSDEVVPVDVVDGDRAHRLFITLRGSPNQNRADRVWFDQVFGATFDGEIQISVDNDKYQVFGVVSEPELGRTVVEATDELIEGCFPVRRD